MKHTAVIVEGGRVTLVILHTMKCIMKELATTGQLNKLTILT